LAWVGGEGPKAGTEQGREKDQVFQLGRQNAKSETRWGDLYVEAPRPAANPEGEKKTGELASSDPTGSEAKAGTKNERLQFTHSW